MNNLKIFEDIKSKIKDFINKNQKFPTKKEIENTLNIKYSLILEYGGILKLKEDLNWTKGELIDLSGFYNKSRYELEIANYLILNNIAYKREQLIVEGRTLRSDFLFILENNKEVHCEVWGYNKSRIDGVSGIYNKRRKEKEELYKARNIKYISIEGYELFGYERFKYGNIDKYLYNIFSKYINYKFKCINYEAYMVFGLLTDDQLLNALIKYSNDKDYLPTVKDLNVEGVRGLWVEAKRRYENGYREFAQKYNKKIHLMHEYLKEHNIKKNFKYLITSEELIQIGIDMIKNYNKILTVTEAQKLNYNSYNKIRRYIMNKDNNYSTIDFKLDVYKYCLNNNVIIPDEDIKYIQMLINKKGNGITGIITEKQCEEAKEIYNELNTETLIKLEESVENNISESIDNFMNYLKEKYIKENVKYKITLDEIIEIGIDMIKRYNKILTVPESQKLKYPLYSKIRRYTSTNKLSMISYKLKVYNNCLDNNIIIPNDEIKYIEKLTIKKGNGIAGVITEEECIEAKEIYNKINAIKV